MQGKKPMFLEMQSVCIQPVGPRGEQAGWALGEFLIMSRNKSSKKQRAMGRGSHKNYYGKRQISLLNVLQIRSEK